MPPLTRHPDSPAVADVDVEAQASRSGTSLRLRYRLGGVGRVVLPLPAISGRADELWRHTCFEAFVRAEGREGYFEFNLAPSTQWAAYGFDGYRKGMRPAAMAAPRIELGRVDDRFELYAELDLDGFALDDLHWRVGLAAVVEAADGACSYWALKHPPGKPDFHHPDCFALELPETARP